MIQTQSAFRPVQANANFRPKPAGMSLAQSVSVRPQANADVQFGGISSIFTKPFKWVYGKWNGFWNNRLAKDAVNQLQLEREKLVDAQKKFDDQKVSAEAKARLAEGQVSAAEQALAEVEANAVRNFNASQRPGISEQVKAKLLSDANELGKQAKAKKAELENIKKTAKAARAAAGIAAEQTEKIKKDLKRADDLMAQAQQKKREAERNNEAAEMLESVQQFKSENFLATSEAARMMKAIDEEHMQAQVRLEQATGILDSSKNEVAQEAAQVLAETANEDATEYLKQLAEEAAARKGEAKQTQSQNGGNTSAPAQNNSGIDPALADLLKDQK
jgi:putative ABC transport system permease protein